MAKMTKEEVLRILEEEDVEFIRLQFTDMFGNLKNIAITSRELPRALEGAFLVDWPFEAGAPGGRNIRLCPDLDTFLLLPWRPQQGKVGRLLCDVSYPDGTPHPCSPRYLLRKVASQAREKGYSCCVNTECEFFLFHTDDNGVPTTLTHEKAGYLDLSPLDLGENARRDIVLTLEEMGIEVESSHHENAPAQHEIDFHGGEICRMADQVMTVRMAVRSIAKRHGLHATFMPKPKVEVDGSGMHTHFSLYRGGVNIFASQDKNPRELSQEGYYFIGGLLAHSQEIALITNPIVNSYKRLVPGYGAPTELTWTNGNQNSWIRIPWAADGQAKVELRSPDGASNPYLVFALCLAAGLDGIEQKTSPSRQGDPVIWIRHFPENLKEAIAYFEESEWVAGILGEEFCQRYVEEKKKEWLRFARQVTPWELEEYLYRI